MPQEHYFSTEPRVASRPMTVRVDLPDRTLELVTDRGVFAHGRIDRGTELLLRSIPPPPSTGDLLDLGCGYGPIAVTVALRAPAARVWAIEVNQRALELCSRNARANGAANFVVVSPEHVPDGVRFNAVYSNPPVRLGKEALHDVLRTWLNRLAAASTAFLVVQRHLGSDSLVRWLEQDGHEVTRLRSRWGYRVLEVRPAPASAHDGAHAPD
jgi:16S rRNA (guanine1207-N2)-methyltransferase